jgi:predicted secreted protein
MFTDSRSGKIAIVAHCVLNPNSRAQGLVRKPNITTAITNFLLRNNIGIIQMPCPEITYLGPLRKPRTKEEYDTSQFRKLCRKIARDIIHQIQEYNSYGIKTLFILGVEGSPSCGVNETTGVLIEELRKLLFKKQIEIKICGIHLETPEEDIINLEKWCKNLPNYK